MSRFSDDGTGVSFPVPLYIKITGKTYEKILIVGGGSSAGYLNQLTEEATHKRVIAGLKEATAIGNILVQMKAAGENIQLCENKS